MSWASLHLGSLDEWHDDLEKIMDKLEDIGVNAFIQVSPNGSRKIVRSEDRVREDRARLPDHQVQDLR